MQQNQWNESYENGRDYLGLTTLQINRLCSYVNTKKAGAQPKLLDIGCGTGQLVREMFHRGFDCLGIDSSPRAIEIAKQSTQLTDEIKFEVNDATALPEEMFDLVSCKYVVAFISDRTSFFSNIVQCLATDGIFVIITPQRNTLPVKKKFIAIEDNTLFDELNLYFGNITKLKEQGDWWYVCKK